MPSPLPFETEIHDLEGALALLEQRIGESADVADEVRRIRRQLTELLRKKYAALTPWETVLVSRHPERPQTMDYVEMILDEFVELHGDRAFGDDRAIRCGFARLGNFKVLLVGHQKGHTLKERQACYYGCAHPEGYRKALNKMRLAAKFKIPVICLIDTPGAFPGIGAEERGQAQLIATSILEMSRLPTPVVCVVIGEGGSGGAGSIVREIATDIDNDHRELEPFRLMDREHADVITGQVLEEIAAPDDGLVIFLNTSRSITANGFAVQRRVSPCPSRGAPVPLESHSA